MKKTIITICALAVSSLSYAQSNTSKTFSAKSTLAAKCEIKSANINIGTIVGGQPSSSGSNTFSIKCTNKTPYQYYVGNWQWNIDCTYLEGANKKERLRYGIHNLTTPTYMVNNTTGNGAGGVLVSGMGEGIEKNIVLQATINPSDQASWVCPTEMKFPGAGKNPYVAADTYSDNLIFGIIY